jgi:hypothetical protein
MSLHYRAISGNELKAFEIGQRSPDIELKEMIAYEQGQRKRHQREEQQQEKYQQQMTELADSFERKV